MGRKKESSLHPHTTMEGQALKRRKLSQQWEDASSDSETAPEDPPAKPPQEEPDMASLRATARQRYLSKREEEKISLLEREVQELEEDVEQYGWHALTEKERREIEYKREILQIAQSRRVKPDDGYQLPEEQPLGEFKPQAASVDHVEHNWEKTQLEKISPDSESEDDEYEYVFDEDNNVAFDSDQDQDDELANAIEEEQKRIHTIDSIRKSLPVFKYRNQLLEAIDNHPVMIVVGETGSGKTTQLPQFLREHGYCKDGKKIVCTQPRRVAATSVAERVADEVGCRVGQEVGYSIRFEDKTSERTEIKYMTDGMMLREFLADPELSSYSAIIIDEAHERTLQTDVLLGLVKDISQHRPELRIVISSATMKATKFSDYFDNAPIFNVPGRRFPVSVHYTKSPEGNYLHAAITTLFQIHTTQGPGDVLIFLTGQDEIETVAENIGETCRKLGDKFPELIICPIYANMPPELQQRIFEPTREGARKVVIATNIAETSITIDGIAYVIDSGFVKENVFNPSTGMESLVVVPCSQASADQRAGRAGRVGPGKCFRLYTKWAYFHEMAENATPEILRTNLVSVILLLLSLGITDLIHFEFLDHPSADALMKALELLYALGALNESGQLTKIGRQMAEFPTNPMLAKSLLKAASYGCLDEVLTISSMLGESGSLFFRPKEKRVHADKAHAAFASPHGDHLMLLEIFNQWSQTGHSYQWCKDNFLQGRTLNRVRNIRDQLERLCEKTGIFQDREPADKVVVIQKSITAGFFANVAKLAKGGDSYRTMKRNQSVHVHPSSVLFKVKPPAKFLLYYELMMTSKEFMRNVMPIQEKWLYELAPHYFKVEKT